MATQFTAVYNCFLGKITDDLYIELTPEDTLRDLQCCLTAFLSLNFQDRTYTIILLKKKLFRQRR